MNVTTILVVLAVIAGCLSILFASLVYAIIGLLLLIGAAIVS